MRSSALMRELAANTAMLLPPVRAWRTRRARTSYGDPREDVQRFLDQHEFFLSNLGADRIRDRVIAEIGPGDALPLGLLLIGSGARRYVAIDRFLGSVDSDEARSLYRALADASPAHVKEGWRARGLDPREFPWTGSHGGDAPVTLVRRSIEDVDFRILERADVVISFNVIEHVSDVARSVSNMAGLVTEEGAMLHRIDYGPHGPWLEERNPLEFLTPPPWLWSLLGASRGYPNRRRHALVLDALLRAGFRSDARVDRRFAPEDVAACRRRLSREFREMTVAELEVREAEILSTRRGEPRLLGTSWARLVASHGRPSRP